MKYSISFTEEGIMNPKYQDHIGGRMEVFVEDEPYNIEEVRFLTTKKKEFNELREEWECKEVSQKELDELRDIIKNNFNIWNTKHLKH
jgi:hypothetical protein